MHFFYIDGLKNALARLPSVEKLGLAFFLLSFKLLDSFLSSFLRQDFVSLFSYWKIVTKRYFYFTTTEKKKNWDDRVEIKCTKCWKSVEGEDRERQQRRWKLWVILSNVNHATSFNAETMYFTTQRNDIYSRRNAFIFIFFLLYWQQLSARLLFA